MSYATIQKEKRKKNYDLWSFKNQDGSMANGRNSHHLEPLWSEGSIVQNPFVSLKCLHNWQHLQ